MCLFCELFSPSISPICANHSCCCPLTSPCHHSFLSVQLSSHPLLSFAFTWPSPVTSLSPSLRPQPASHHPTFLALQWSAAQSGTSRFSTLRPTLWTFAGSLPTARFCSTGWSILLWLAPGPLSRWVSIRQVGRNVVQHVCIQRKHVGVRLLIYYNTSYPLIAAPLRSYIINTEGWLREDN